MNETATEANKLWGIYHTDREYARTVGDPLRTVVEAPTKLAAEEAAARLGFGEPWAHPVSREQVNRAQWLPQHNLATGRKLRTRSLAAFEFESTPP